MKYLGLYIFCCAVITCFTVLAIQFGHWWIVLFAALFGFNIPN